MSQNYFDTYINLIGEHASQLVKVIPANKLTNEEISNWIED